MKLKLSGAVPEKVGTVMGINGKASHERAKERNAIISFESIYFFNESFKSFTAFET